MRKFLAYAAHPDPVAALGNRVALVVGWNTPFYPLYLWWLAGPGIFPAGLLTLCSAPFFLAVPAVARRWPMAGRSMTGVVGVGNTLFCTWLLGDASGTPLFLLPCAVLAALLYRPGEGWARLLLAGGPLLLLVVPVDWMGPPLATIPADAMAAVWRMNLISVGGLLAFLGLQFAGLFSLKR